MKTEDLKGVDTSEENKDKNLVVRGSKGKKSKAPRTPIEAPDSLISRSYAKIIDLISEGEIVGVEEDGVFLDETPAHQSGAGFKWEQRTGTQYQDHLAGFPAVENEITVNTELTTANPWIQSFTNPNLSAVKITFRLPRFMNQNETNGDISGTTVNFQIHLSVDNGPYSSVHKGKFSGKTTGGYERSVRVDLPEGAEQWRIRVVRLTADSTFSSLSNTTIIKSFTEVIDSKFRYPNSAIVGVEFDAESFGGAVPQRAYLAKGRIIRVPSNYDAATRTYTGAWNGVFKLSYTNNPAWIYYDLLLHPRYGLGDRIDATQIDKWSLYQIAQYCDEMVDDGKGGKEPRFACNLYLQSQADAYKVLQDIASVFRGITYWGAGQAVVSADMPSDPVYSYTNANVKDGEFSYKGSKRSTRYSAALVAWNDPTDMYRQKVEYVQDEKAVARFGLQTTDITAFGCTSQGQAQRAGRWSLLTNLLETETVSFTVGLDGIKARPHQIIRIADNNRAGKRIGGRVGDSTLNSVTVDSVKEVEVGDTITVTLADGSVQTREIREVSGNTITVRGNFRLLPAKESVWIWESDELKSQLFRIIGISEVSPLEYSITASKYVEGKHDSVDSGTILSQRPITSVPEGVQLAPTNITAISNSSINQTMAITTATVMWEEAKGAVRYEVEWSRDNSGWVSAGVSYTTEIDIVGIYEGNYSFRIRAENALGVTSPWEYSGNIYLYGKEGLPPKVGFLRTRSEVFGIRLEWGFPEGAEDTLYTQIQYNVTPDDAETLSLGEFAYPTDTHLMSGLRSAQRYYFRARLVDRTGNIGPWTDWVFGQSSADADEILDYIVGKITETELSQKLREEIERIDGISGELGQQGIDISELEGLIEQLESQITDITGAQNWDSTTSYLAGSLVQDEGALYRAKKDTPAGVLVSDAEYWEKVGDYASIGEAVIALNVQVSNMQAAVDEATGSVKSQGEVISTLIAKSRGERADGDKADALEGWNTQSQISERDRVEASDKEALAERLLVIDAEVGDNKSQISSLQQAFVDESVSTAERLDKIIAVRPVRADGDKADALEGFKSQTQIVESSRVQASDSEASAERVLLMQAELGSTDAALRQVSETVVGIDDKVSTSWSVRMQVNQKGQYVYAGVGLGIENVGGVLQSQFLIEANRFALLNTINGVTTSPFIVDGGQTYINNAVIKDGSIVNAKIADAEITSAKIKDASITSAKIKDASIERAKIKDAAVDTLQLAGRSVTVPQAAFTAGGISAQSSQWVDLQHLTVYGDAETMVTFSAFINLLTGYKYENALIIRMTLDGAVLFEGKVVGAVKSEHSGVYESPYYSVSIPHMIYATGSGSVVKVQGRSNGTCNVSLRTLTSLTVKR